MSYITDCIYGQPLTSREKEVIDGILEGCTNKQIALKLSVCENTIKNHICAIFIKLGLHSRTQVAVKMLSEKVAAV